MNPTLYAIFLVAVAAEVVGTTALKASDGFTRIGPSLIVVLGYGVAFYFLSLALRVMPVGVAYAMWSGLGIVLVTLVGIAVYRQVPDFWALFGMGLILAGVLIVNLLSKTVTH